MDGFETTTKPKLDYPFPAPEVAGVVREVADGILWVRMPLPFALKWINLWLIRDGEGWALVDTGVAMEESRGIWRTIFEDVLKGAPITRVICTHMHPDHIGLAGWICRKFSARLWITRLEYITCRMLVADTGREAPEEGVTFFKAAGWDEDALDSYRVRFGGFGKAVSRMPDAYRRLCDGESFDIGGRTWRIITGNGHSPEHACLVCDELSVIISGDQILPRISSNVSVFPTEPDGDPLDDWIRSCHKLRGALAGDLLVLPAHNEPFRGVHLRLDDLISGHEKALNRVHSRLVTEPRRAVDLFGAMFARPIGPDVLSMATGETIAHLNCLIGRDLAVREVKDGVAWYRAAA
jgi:glyoxylase-like metal-dependent hydrolase (beta-lactamase superfamily II)